MGDVGTSIVTAVVVALVVAVGAVLLGPVRRRLGRRVTRLEADHVITWTIETDPAKTTIYPLDAAVEFYFPTSAHPSSPPPKDSLKNRWKWAHDNGGADVGLTSFTLTLECAADASVVFDPPLVRQRVRPVEPGELNYPVGLGGGSIAPRRYLVDLDRADPNYATFAPSTTNPDQTPSFYLTLGEVERLEIIASAARGRHDWTLDIPIVVAGRSRTIHVDDHGDPFVTIGRLDAHRVGVHHRQSMV